jgi:hypothetical protein
MLVGLVALQFVISRGYAKDVVSLIQTRAVLVASSQERGGTRDAVHKSSDKSKSLKCDFTVHVMSQCKDTFTDGLNEEYEYGDAKVKCLAMGLDECKAISCKHEVSQCKFCSTTTYLSGDDDKNMVWQVDCGFVEPSGVLCDLYLIGGEQKQISPNSLGSVQCHPAGDVNQDNGERCVRVKKGDEVSQICDGTYNRSGGNTDSLCEQNGFPTGCCTIESGSQIICSDKNGFTGQPDAAQFADCSSPCTPGSTTVTTTRQHHHQSDDDHQHDDDDDNDDDDDDHDDGVNVHKHNDNNDDGDDDDHYRHQRIIAELLLWR